MKKNIALLCDYGLDDAVATLYLLGHADEFGRIDILPIAGNMPLKTSMHNAKRLLCAATVLPPNVRLVDTTALAQPEDFLPHIHGNDGMGDILPPDEHYAGEVLDYEAWLAEVDASYTLVSLGPCTVTRDILRRAGAHPLVLMGGNVAEKPNHGPYEFNHGMDAEAFAECVTFPHRAATLDTCHCPGCDFNVVPLNGDGLFRKMAERSVQMSRERNEAGNYIYDLVAAVYLLRPEKFAAETRVDAFGNAVSVLRYTDTAPLI